MNTYFQKLAKKHGVPHADVRAHWKAAKRDAKRRRIKLGSPVFWQHVYITCGARVQEQAEKQKALQKLESNAKPEKKPALFEPLKQESA